MENKKIYIIVIIFLPIAVIWTIFIVGKIQSQCTPTTNIISNEPWSGKRVGTDTEIILYIDKPITQRKLKELNIETTPNFKFNIKATQKVIKIVPTESLKEKTEYQVSIYPKSARCLPIKNLPYTINFQTSDGKTYSKDLGVLFRSKSLLPVVNENYNIDYWSEENNYLITINSTECEKAKKMALEYLEENGLNLEKIKIVWFSKRGIQAKCIPQN